VLALTLPFGRKKIEKFFLYPELGMAKANYSANRAKYLRGQNDGSEGCSFQIVFVLYEVGLLDPVRQPLEGVNR